MGRWRPLPDGLPPEARRLVERLRLLKDRTGLSMSSLSAKTAYSRSSWQRYLSGSRLAPWQAADALARLAGEDRARLRALWQLAAQTWEETEDAPGARGVPDGRGAPDAGVAPDEQGARGAHAARVAEVGGGADGADIVEQGAAGFRPMAGPGPGAGLGPAAGPGPTAELPPAAGPGYPGDRGPGRGLGRRGGSGLGRGPGHGAGGPGHRGAAGAGAGPGRESGRRLGLGRGLGFGFGFGRRLGSGRGPGFGRGRGGLLPVAVAGALVVGVLLGLSGSESGSRESPEWPWALATRPAYEVGCVAAACEGRSPGPQKCDQDAVELKAVYSVQYTVRLMYSARCAAVWGEVQPARGTSELSVSRSDFGAPHLERPGTTSTRMLEAAPTTQFVACAKVRGDMKCAADVLQSVPVPSQRQTLSVARLRVTGS
jgi:transcriptional regulator with XRE-family HTH domain